MTKTNPTTPSLSSAIADPVARANAYIDAVLSGRIVAGKWVRLACQRQRDDLARAWQYSFDHAKANRVCRFIEALPHIKGS